MAYIGKTPVIGNFQKCDAITVVNGQAAYTMQVGGVNVNPESENHMLVSLNGVLQAPVDSFTISGSTITFASNLATGDVIDFIMLLGNVLDLGTPSDNTVTAAKIGANAVTSAKLNNDIISGATELATAPADTDEFLVSDAGTLKRIDYSLIKGGGIESVTQFRLTTNTNTSTDADITSNWEVVDDASYTGIGSAVTESSGIFTFPSTGIWLVMHSWYLVVYGGDGTVAVSCNVTQNNSTYDEVSRAYAGTGSTTDQQSSNFSIVDVTDTSNVKVKFATHSFSTVYVSGSTGSTYSGAMFMRLGDT